MDLTKIFTGMNKGPEAIQNNFEALQDQMNDDEFKITTYPLVTESGWTGEGPNAFTLMANSKYNIIAVSCELIKPAGIGFTSTGAIASDPLLSANGFNWARIVGVDWGGGTILPVVFHDGKIYTEHPANDVWGNATSNDSVIKMNLQHVFVWKK